MAEPAEPLEGTLSSTPQYAGQTLSSICALRPRPLIMTGLFRDVLVRHFADVSNIEDTALRGSIWREGETTDILIESIHRWTPQLTEHRPAVLIKRNAYSNRRLSVGDRRHGPSADMQGNSHFTTAWVGSHTLFCLAGTGALAEILSSEVQRELTEFGPVIMKSVDLLRFQVMEIGSVSEVEEATENFAVPITVGYAYTQTWVLQQEAAPLRRVSLSLLLDC